MRLSKNAFSEVKVPKARNVAGQAGFDNSRENIDPHIRTKVVNSMEGTIEKVPVNNNDVVNKLALDTAVGAIAYPEGTDVKSTGEGGGTKFLREDGDGTCSWQAPAGGGDVTAGANLTDETLVQGDGGAKGVKTSTVTAAEVASNTAARHTQGTDTALGTMTADIDMDGSYQIVGLQAPAANGEAIRQTAKITEAKMEAADDHVNNNTQAHSDYLLNSGADEAVGPLTITADNSSADTAYVPMVLYNTDATPPAASGFPVGTLYVQYTA